MSPCMQVVFRKLGSIRRLGGAWVQSGCVCRWLRMILFFFFFQAEDGIRDLIVTGVQTCALPISFLIILSLSSCALFDLIFSIKTDAGSLFSSCGTNLPCTASWRTVERSLPMVSEIGRASCRERV